MGKMEKLRIYQKALQLVSEIYILIKKNPGLFKDFSLCDQIKRASVSIVANIAEGYMRSYKHFKNYLQISSGSANEVVSLLQIINLIHKIDTVELQNSFKLLGRQINAFSRSLRPTPDH